MRNIIFFFAIASLLYSCKGDTGPAGPAGQNGTNGVANIQTFTFTTTNSNWGYDANSKTFYTDVEVDAITQDVVDAGTVEVFWGLANGSGWEALPWNIGYDWYNYAYVLSTVEVDYGLVSTSTPSNPGGQSFKIVVIPPAQRLANPDVNWNDFNDIKKHFRIHDAKLSSANAADK